MIRIKMCGLKRQEDITAANELLPDYIGFVFASRSKRYISPENALLLKSRLNDKIKVVGVFVDEKPEAVAQTVNSGAIDIVQLHGREDNAYIGILRSMTDSIIIKAIRIRSERDIEEAENSIADMILLDAGAGDGTTFDWEIVREIKRPYFLAGGLTPQNVGEAVRRLHPYGVDVSSGLETQGIKDKKKMAEFISAVRKEDTL